MDNKIKEANFVSAVIYIHNNEREITPFLEWLDTQLDLNFKKYEIICVDDGSMDASEEAVRAYGKNRAKEAVSLLHMSYFQGLEVAMTRESISRSETLSLNLIRCAWTTRLRF